MINKKGLTLIEVIVVVTLIGIVITVIFSPIIFSHKNFNRQNEQTVVVSNARSTMDYLTREIRKVNEVPEKIDNTYELGGSIYKLENRKLFKNNEKVREGIDELEIISSSKKVVITISIQNNNNKDYELKSTINIR